MTRNLLFSVLATVFAVAGFVPAGALAAERPRLAVVLVVDQLSQGLFQSKLPQAQEGLGRLVKEGFTFVDARYEAAPALTACGHATVATGAYPDVHGITGNTWFDARSKKPQYAVEDPAFKTLGRAPDPRDGTAPSALRAGTLGDALKATYPRAKSIAIGGKDRSTILLAGQSPDACVWLDAQRPTFTSSTRFALELPKWLSGPNERLAKVVQAGAAWQRPGGFSTEEENFRTFVKDVPGFGKHFPHTLQNDAPPAVQAVQLLVHPMADAFIVDAALAAVKEEKLGTDETPDLLAVAFSSFDKVLHDFGPDSPEAAGLFSNLDHAVGQLLAELDKVVGKGKYVVVFTSDHGGAPVPEVVKDRKIDGGRVDLEAVRAVLEKTADQALGQGDWFEGFFNTGYYVKSEKAQAKIHQADEALRAAAKALPGVLDLVPRSEIQGGRYGSIGELYRRGMDPERSPDFFLLVKPYWLYGTEDVAGHAAFHAYDRSVPLVWFGAGIRKGEGIRAELVDIAPTLATLLESEKPTGCQGRILSEAMQRFSK